MADIRVRKLGDWVVATLRVRAKNHGRSLEAELRDVLRDEALRLRREFCEELRVLRQETQDKYGLLPDSTAEIRADRDVRG